MVDALDYSKTVQKERKAASKVATDSVIVNGVNYPMLKDPRSGMWRVRKRTCDIEVDFSTGVSEIRAAKEKAREKLESQAMSSRRRRAGDITLRELCDTYERMPKRAGEDTALANVQRLRKLVHVAWGKKLEEVMANEVTSDLWEDYAKKRQGGKLDLSTRRAENRGINAAIRMAVSVFRPMHALAYEKEGVKLDLEAVSRVQWLPEVKVKILRVEPERLEAMYAALPALKVSDYPMWRTIMIARYAGLRSGEISASHKDWLEPSKPRSAAPPKKTKGQKPEAAAVIWKFAIHDRPEQGYWHKTGEDYVAPIISMELEKDLLEGPDGLLIDLSDPGTGKQPRTSRERFFRSHCNKWLRQFIPRPHKGLHRLRALYLEEVMDIRATEIRAEQAGIEAARQAAGHTSAKTTQRHYLPGV